MAIQEMIAHPLMHGVLLNAKESRQLAVSSESQLVVRRLAAKKGLQTRYRDRQRAVIQAIIQARHEA